MMLAHYILGKDSSLDRFLKDKDVSIVCIYKILQKKVGMGYFGRKSACEFKTINANLMAVGVSSMHI